MLLFLFSYSSGVKRPTNLPAYYRIKILNANSIMERLEIPMGEDVIRTCVTPRKVQSVHATLQKEKERHR